MCEAWALLSLPAESASRGPLDLTELVGVPLPSSVSFVAGYGGFPAYSFGPGANVGRPARTLIPNKTSAQISSYVKFTQTAGQTLGGQKPKERKYSTSVQFSSVAQSCPTLCDPMNRSTPGLPVHHQLMEFTQNHVHRVGDAIQPSHPLSSPSSPARNPSQHQFAVTIHSHGTSKLL